jgi:hypothetical protein
MARIINPSTLFGVRTPPLQRFSLASVGSSSCCRFHCGNLLVHSSRQPIVRSRGRLVMRT